MTVNIRFCTRIGVLTLDCIFTVLTTFACSAVFRPFPQLLPVATPIVILLYCRVLSGKEQSSHSMWYNGVHAFHKNGRISFKGALAYRLLTLVDMMLFFPITMLLLTCYGLTIAEYFTGIRLIHKETEHRT
jgi:hypothetical protein